MPTVGLRPPASEVRLPLAHTSVGEDAHRVDALLGRGGLLVVSAEASR